MRSSYFVTLQTTEQGLVDYEESANTMAKIFTDLFGDAEKIAQLTKGAELMSCHTEIDVSMTEEGLRGRAVIDMEADKKVPLDKKKLTELFKKSSTWPDCKVTKSAVPDD